MEKPVSPFFELCALLFVVLVTLIARANRVDDLLNVTRRLTFEDVAPQVFETTRTGNDHFTLAVGPLDKSSAHRLRWKRLDTGESARITVGEDHKGDPRPPGESP